MKLRIEPFDRMTPGELFAVLRLRQAVFCLEQRVDCEELDALDPAAMHLWCEADDGTAAGCLRILPPGTRYGEASVGRVAVAAAQRRRGMARKMMGAALEYIGRTWGAPVRISSQEYVVPFYESLGFEVVSDTYAEAGIPHRSMLRR